MNKKKVIVFGTPTHDIATLKRPDISITVFHYDVQGHTFQIVYERGLEVHQIFLAASTIVGEGIVDFEKLQKFLVK